MMVLPKRKTSYRKNKKRRFQKLGTDLRDFLTGEERRQIDALLAKAEARMHEKGDEGCSEQIFLMACQCKCQQIMQKEEEKERFEEDVKKLLTNICIFCKGHDMCSEYCSEELPFP